MTPRDLREMLIAGADELGTSLSGPGADSCLVYLAELTKWNRKINLTAIRDEKDIIIKHFLDSFAFRKGFAPFKGVDILDLGSGAGFPAIPVRVLLPEVKVALVESVGKKAAFLRHVVRCLHLSRAEIRESRIEHLPASMDNSFDVITARAFASMDRIIAEGHRFLRTQGVMVLSRGPEGSVTSEALQEAGMEIVSKIDFVLPFSDYRRSLWVFQKGP